MSIADMLRENQPFAISIAPPCTPLYGMRPFISQFSSFRRETPARDTTCSVIRSQIRQERHFNSRCASFVSLSFAPGQPRNSIAPQQCPRFACAMRATFRTISRWYRKEEKEVLGTVSSELFSSSGCSDRLYAPLSALSRRLPVRGINMHRGAIERAARRCIISHVASLAATLSWNQATANLTQATSYAAMRS